MVSGVEVRPEISPWLTVCDSEGALRVSRRYRGEAPLLVRRQRAIPHRRVGGTLACEASFPRRISNIVVHVARKPALSPDHPIVLVESGSAVGSIDTVNQTDSRPWLKMAS